MKQSLCLVLLNVYVVGCLGCQGAPVGSERNAEPPPPLTVRVDHQSDLAYEAADRAVEQAMQRTITLNAKNLPLLSLIQSLRDTTGVNVSTHWQSLELVGIDKDSLVAIEVDTMPANRLLSMALKQVSADAFDDDKASFAIVEGVLMISTIRELTQHTQIRVYDVNWFIRPSTPLPKDWEEAFNGSATMLARQSALQCLAAPTHDQTEFVISRQERIDQIIEMIITIIGEEDYWIDEKYTVCELGGLLVVNTTRELHLEIEALLNTLHKAHIKNLKQEIKFRAAAAQLEQAQAQHQSGDYRQALRTIERALHTDPSNLKAQALHQVIVEAIED